MRLLPVLDIKAGQAVHARAGRRQEYRPIQSCLTPSCQPRDVATALRTQFGFTELYVAELDALAGASPALALYQELHSASFRLWLDAGVRTAADLEPLLRANITKIVLGLETITGPEVLAEACARAGSERLVFSLDLKEGQPLGDLSHWRQPDAWSILTEAHGLGVRQMILLDLARVGGYGGTGTEELCQRLATAYPDVVLVAGGGIRHGDDLRRLQACGVHAALVASALHDGRLRPEEVRRWQAQQT